MTDAHELHTPVRADAVDRATKAWSARVLGLSWAAAADAAGYADASTACRAVRNYFGELPQIDAQELRQTWRERGEWLWRQIVVDVREQRPGATRAGVALMGRMAQLDGLDQPDELLVGRMPDEEEFKQVMHMAMRARTEAIEGDPFAD